MKRRSIAADLRPVVAEAEAAGWRLVAGKRHPRLISPRGRLVVLPATPSDWRGVKNARAQVRRVIREEAAGPARAALSGALRREGVSHTRTLAG